MIRKTLNLCKKSENKLSHVMRCFPSHAHFYDQMSSILHYFLWKIFLPQPPKKIFPWKKPQSKKTSHHMSQLIFQLLTKINCFYFLFPCCYQTDPYQIYRLRKYIDGKVGYHHGSGDEGMLIGLKAGVIKKKLRSQ